MMKVAMTIAMALLALAPAADLELGKPVGDVALGKDSLAALTKDGKVVAVYFWSSDCPYGPPNFDNIKKVDATFADNAKVKVVIVSSFGEPEAKANAWAKDAGIKSTFLYDSENNINDRTSNRFLGSITGRYFPTDWVTFEGTFAYDNRARFDRNEDALIHQFQRGRDNAGPDDLADRVGGIVD